MFIDLNIQIIFQQYPFPPHLSRVWYRLCFCPVPHLTRGPGPKTDMQISQHSIYWTFHFSFNQLLLSDSKIDFNTISCFQTNKGSRIQIVRMPQLVQELIKQIKRRKPFNNSSLRMHLSPSYSDWQLEPSSWSQMMRSMKGLLCMVVYLRVVAWTSTEITSVLDCRHPDS